jgi:hypothetical protein
MEPKKRILAFIELGKILRKENTLTHRFVGASSSPLFSAAISEAIKYNPWFTNENIALALQSLGDMLQEEEIKKWLGAYKDLSAKNTLPKKVGVIMAGNIPLVGFHDFLCVLMSGNCIQAKLSSDDSFLLPAIANILIEIEPSFKEFISFSTTLKLSSEKEQAPLEAFIATGSNNSAKQFEYYLKNYPRLIRRNRNSIGILSGNEGGEELIKLGADVFHYFGMGCRNVSKIYIPHDYNVDTFFEAMVDFGEVIHHHKYANNYLYYRSIYLLNSEKFLDNNFIALKEADSIASPIGTLHYERYTHATALHEQLQRSLDQIQCIACNQTLPDILESLRVPLGNTQQPRLWNYADGVDTMKFLLGLQ